MRHEIKSFRVDFHTIPIIFKKTLHPDRAHQRRPSFDSERSAGTGSCPEKNRPKPKAPHEKKGVQRVIPTRPRTMRRIAPGNPARAQMMRVIQSNPISGFPASCIRWKIFTMNSVIRPIIAFTASSVKFLTTNNATAKKMIITRMRIATPRSAIYSILSLRDI
jgi:hypothetical protein